MRFVMGRPRALFQRFRRATEAVAAVEFALILPIMLTLYIGSVEVSSAIAVDQRVATVSGSLGDLVARAPGTIPKSEIDDYFLAASATMAPYDASGVQQIVTGVKLDADGKGTVMWSVATNGAAKHDTGTAYTVPDRLKHLAADGFVIASEARLSYEPMIGYIFDSNFNLYHEFFFLPRFGKDIVYEPTS